MFLCLKTHWLCKSPELSADCGSPERHILYIIQNQYLMSCSPHTQWHSRTFFFGAEQISGRLQFESCIHPFLLFSFFTFLFPDFCMFSRLVVADSPGFDAFQDECSIKSCMCVSARELFSLHVGAHLQLGIYGVQTFFAAQKLGPHI